MVAERKPQIARDRKESAQVDLRVLEVDFLREVQGNYHQFAEAIKPILKQGAEKLSEHGIFPEEESSQWYSSRCYYNKNSRCCL